MTGNTHSVTYRSSTHAPLFKRYSGAGFVEVGESGKYGPIDPETGAEYKALGGNDHKYNRDYKVGSSYPRNTFVFGKDGEGNSVSHDELKATLKDIGHWTDLLTPVIVPHMLDAGEMTWRYGFMFRPVEHAPNMDRVADTLTDKLGEDNVYASRMSVEGFLSDE